ncbi:MAG: tyrosine-type recombinase/integrase [Pyramidobacter sp.]|nr:tyrosine-type recombinase/integrase [Pyramidobacter sp.]
MKKLRKREIASLGEGYWSDGHGLYLRVYPTGTRTWVFRYRDGNSHDRKEKLGEYPEMTLAQAREACAQMRQRVINGLPVREVTWTFADVAQKWHEHRLAGKELSERHLSTVQQRLKTYILPKIGKRQIEELKRVELVQLVQSIAARGKIETANRTAGIISQVFAYAEDCGIVESGHGIVAATLSRALPTAHPQHFATTDDPAKIGALMRAIERYSGSRTSGLALRFVAYTMTRSGEVRRARWKEIDVANAMWTIPAEHMKRRRIHKVPLSRQAMAILEQARPLTYNGPDSLIFRRDDSQSLGRANTHGGEFSDYALLRPLYQAHEKSGGTIPKITVHGFRSMASTILNSLHWDKEIIEMQLSHMDADRVRAVYNHSEYLEERRELLQFWADWLDARRDEEKPTGRTNGNAVPTPCGTAGKIVSLADLAARVAR